MKYQDSGFNEFFVREFEIDSPKPIKAIDTDMAIQEISANKIRRGVVESINRKLVIDLESEDITLNGTNLSTLV